MKRGLIFLLLLAVSVFCVFSQNTKRITGKVRELTGEVELKAAGASAFIKAKIGDTIAQDTIVSTGFKSTAIIEVGSSSIMVRPLTRLSLEEIKSSSDTESVNVELQTGRIKVDVKPPAGTKTSLIVQSPSATASVRGTSFEFDAYNLSVNEGIVAFHGNKGKGLLIPAGKTSSIGADGKAIDPLEDDIIPAKKSLRRAVATATETETTIDLTIGW